jgi:hypothetical protein
MSSNETGEEYAPTDRRQARAEAKVARARAKALRPWYRKKRWWLLGSLVAIIVIIAVANTGDDDDDTVATEAEDEESVEPETIDGQEVFAIGDTASTGDFDVTVHAFEDPFTEGTDIVPPDEGHRFVAVEVEMTNTGDEPLPISTLALFEVIDQLDRPWAATISGSQRPALDEATVAPGQTRRGWVVFQVGNDATDLVVRIKGNITATGSLFALDEAGA